MPRKKSTDPHATAEPEQWLAGGAEFLRPKQARPPTEAETLALIATVGALLTASGPTRPPGKGARPLSWTELRERGSSMAVLLWLFYQGPIQHWRRTSSTRSRSAKLRKAESVQPQEGSYFSLTELGLEFGRLCRTGKKEDPESVSFSLVREVPFGKLLPEYETESRLFRWGGHVLKKFRQPSAIQQLVLASFQELGWPEWIDDPLLRVPQINPKTHLHNTINALNRYQKEYLVQFHADGTGRRIGWSLR